MGKRYIVSEQNEKAWRATLSYICESIIQRGLNKGIELGSLEISMRSDEMTSLVFENIQCLWKEEVSVARAVLQSVQMGEEF